MPSLSTNGSLLVELAVDGPASLVVDGVAFTRKAEHHLTVFGSARGRLLLAAASIDASLLARVNAIAAEHAWNVSLVERFVLAVEPTDGGELRTIFAMASARMPEFFALVRELIANDAGDAGRALALSLASPPPAHVTLFTTDPAGRRAIGFDTVTELDAAFARGESDARVRARWLAPGAVPTPRLDA
jgi:hypothetical protein